MFSISSVNFFDLEFYKEKVEFSQSITMQLCRVLPEPWTCGFWWSTLCLMSYNIYAFSFLVDFFPSSYLFLVLYDFFPPKKQLMDLTVPLFSFWLLSCYFFFFFSLVSSRVLLHVPWILIACLVNLFSLLIIPAFIAWGFWKYEALLKSYTEFFTYLHFLEEGSVSGSQRCRS